MARRTVITERDVTRAIRDGKTSLDVRDAVVTPAARDEARRLHLALESSSPPPAPRVGSAEEAEYAKDAEGKTRAKRSTVTKGGRASAPPASSAVRQASSAPSAPSASSHERASLRIALGADHGGVAMKDTIAARLRELGHDVTDVGTSGTEPVDYPDFASAVARRVADGKADFGIMVDGAGIGSCMAANKVPGVRAAMCYDVTTAINAREHNDARVLTLGGGLIGMRLALAIAETFLATPFAGGRHAARVAKIDKLDHEGRS